MMKMKKLSKRLLNFTSNDKERRIIEARLSSSSNNTAAELIDIPRRTVDRAVNRVIERAALAGEEEMVRLPKILTVDIETAPLQAYLWSLWQHGTNIGAMESRTYILSWAAKWLGEEEVLCDALCYSPDYTPGMEDDTRMVQGVWNLLDEADFVVAHNGDNFDIKHLNTAFLRAGMPPPSPYKSIDTLKIVKRTFKFDSNKLQFLLTDLMDDSKEATGGMDTWIGCMKGDMDAWEKMVHYNKGDVTKLEELYLRIRSWDRLHPSSATWGGTTDEPVCTVCGSESVHKDGNTTSTGVSVFEVWRCDDCGTTMRGRQSILSPDQKKNLLIKAK